MKIKRKYKFDKHNWNYVNDIHRNALFLRTQEQWLNDKLNYYGVVFLNDVLDQLGFERKPYGYKYGCLKGNCVLIEFGMDKLIKKANVHGDKATKSIEFEIVGLENIEKTWFKAYKKCLK